MSCLAVLFLAKMFEFLALLTFAVKAQRSPANLLPHITKIIRVRK